MDLGQRIKQARLEAGLSQRQLCGDMVTRNMLSLIENGSARPSMDTLRYFAARLGKPVGWFLEEPTASPNQACITSARSFWRSGNGEGALAELENYRAPDDQLDSERGLLLFLSCLSAAQQAASNGRMPYALHLLQKAETAESPYITDALRQQHQLLLAKAGAPAKPDCDEILLARAELALKRDPARALEILRAAEDQNAVRWQLLSGQVLFALERYAAAAEYLTAVEALHPQVASMLEVCYRELGDYKRAYEYACKTKEVHR